MKKIIVLFVIFTIAAACKKTEESKPRQIEKAAWLIGSWENKSDSGMLTETWRKENDSTYLGNSYFIKGDTLHQEFVRLTQQDDDLIYSPVVKGQNDGKAVDFKMTAATDKQLVFENQKHDFPQKIVYNKITADSLVAEISGMRDGKMSSEKYPMRRNK